MIGPRGLGTLLGVMALALALGLGAAEEIPPGVEDAQSPFEKTALRLGLGASPDQPLEIVAEELEIHRDEGGAERIVFRRNVRVEQGDLRLTCDWLEAQYPQGAGGQPERITARGNVSIVQQDSEVRCSQVVFESDNCVAVCSSPGKLAELHRGGSKVEGQEIVFDLCTGLLKVRGGARVRLVPGGEKGENSP